LAPDSKIAAWALNNDTGSTPLEFSTRRQREKGGLIAKLVFLIFLAVFCLGIYAVRHPLLRAAGRFWIVDEAPVPSDAIIVLGDDNYSSDRAARAAELYRGRWAPVVVASGRFLRPYASIAELIEHDLKSDGVPQQAIIRFTNRADSTREEAEGLAQLIKQKRWKHILLVTSNYHTRRARYIARRVYPAGIEICVSAAADSEFNPQDWWQHRRSVKLFFHETVGMVVSWWELRG
jgi:uncharacterized SAM-binding protein YcdF (DUF218 family)